MIGAWQRKKHAFSHLFRQTGMQELYFPLPYSLSTVDIMCIDADTFTLWNLSRLMNDSEWCILCLKVHGTQKPSVKAL